MNHVDWVLVDTGIWSAFFSKPSSSEKRAVDALLDEDKVALIGPVLAEVLRGFRRKEQADWSLPDCDWQTIYRDDLGRLA